MKIKKNKVKKEKKSKKEKNYDKNKKIKKKKGKSTEEVKEAEDCKIEKEGVENVFEKGERSLKDLIAPSFDRSSPYYMRVGNKIAKTLSINGYPSNVYMGWLDYLYNYEGDMDTMFYIDPADDRGALEALTSKITQFEAQLSIEIEKGSIKNTTRLRRNIDKLYQEREALEQNYENLFYAQILSTLYTDSESDLKKEIQKIENKLKGRRISLNQLNLIQDEAYKSALPFSRDYLKGNYRNFNSGALTACFPFYNSEISHEDGIFLGINSATMTPTLIDLFDRRYFSNSNFTVFGKSGSGKTYSVSLLLMRAALKGIKTTIIDPEGEYKKITEALGGTYIKISPSSKTKINPFDIEEEDETDDNGLPTGRKVLKINEKVSDALNLIGVMNGGLNREQESLISSVISEMYTDRGFVEDDPNSLYVLDAEFNSETGEFYHHGKKKEMPTFSDFYDKLLAMAEKEENADLKSVANGLKMFKKGGVYDMFDCQTSADVDFKNSPIIVFDISSLEESILRPIGMYTALSWTWEKFVKKNPKVKKFVAIDEAWMLVDKNMAGNEFTAAFLDKAARRIRKRNGGLLVASQNFVEFERSPQGQAVLTNASMNIFLRQNPTDIDGVQNVFKLSNGEKNFLLTSRIGELLIKIGEESIITASQSFSYEHQLISPDK